MKSPIKREAIGLAIVLMTLFSHAVQADNYKNPVYEVTITNLTKASQFTPILAATHKPAIAYFELGQPSSAGLALLAEGGNPAELANELLSTGKVIDTANSADVLGTPPLLFAGQSVTLKLEGLRNRTRLSFAAMILPTNDSFVALNSVSLPRYGKKTYYALGYDAGSEPNDEWCANIPGPLCGGEGDSPSAGGEGHVHIANGIQGIGDVNSATYDWRNPVAKVEVRRIY
jgi:hypothetical protein